MKPIKEIQEDTKQCMEMIDTMGRYFERKSPYCLVGSYPYYCERIEKNLKDIQELINVFTEMVKIINSMDYPEYKEDRLFELLGEDWLEKEAL